jgi:predicted tellurium resistance membrane protein TerC
MSEIFTAGAMTALLQVIMIDLVLAGDNAIVIGMRLPVDTCRPSL